MLVHSVLAFQLLDLLLVLVDFLETLVEFFVVDLDLTLVFGDEVVDLVVFLLFLVDAVDELFDFGFAGFDLDVLLSLFVEQLLILKLNFINLLGQLNHLFGVHHFAGSGLPLFHLILAVQDFVLQVLDFHVLDLDMTVKFLVLQLKLVDLVGEHGSFSVELDVLVSGVEGDLGEVVQLVVQVVNLILVLVFDFDQLLLQVVILRLQAVVFLV